MATKFLRFLVTDRSGGGITLRTVSESRREFIKNAQAEERRRKFLRSSIGNMAYASTLLRFVIALHCRSLCPKWGVPRAGVTRDCGLFVVPGRARVNALHVTHMYHRSSH